MDHMFCVCVYVYVNVLSVYTDRGLPCRIRPVVEEAAMRL